MGFKLKDYTKATPINEEQLLTRVDRFWVFAEQHRGAILGSLFLLVVAGVGLGFLIWHGHSQEAKAWNLQQEANQLYIDRPLDEPEKTQEHIQGAISLYEQIIGDYPKTPTAEFAYYFIGNAYSDQTEYQKAIEAYEKHITQYPYNKMLLGLVYQRLGYAYLLIGDQEKGKKAFTEVLQLAEALNKDQVLFEFAKLEEENEQKEQALAYYKELMNQHPYSPLSGEASIRIKALEPPPDTETSKEDSAPSQSEESSEPLEKK